MLPDKFAHIIHHQPSVVSLSLPPSLALTPKTCMQTVQRGDKMIRSRWMAQRRWEEDRREMLRDVERERESISEWGSCVSHFESQTSLINALFPHMLARIKLFLWAPTRFPVRNKKDALPQKPKLHFFPVASGARRDVYPAVYQPLRLFRQLRSEYFVLFTPTKGEKKIRGRKKSWQTLQRRVQNSDINKPSSSVCEQLYIGNTTVSQCNRKLLVPQIRLTLWTQITTNRS